MLLTGSQRMPAPQEVTWEAVLNPDVLRACIPGCEAVNEIAPDTYTITLTLGAGPVRGTFTGRCAVDGKQPRSFFRLVITGGAVQARVSAVAAISLAAASSQTDLAYQVEVKVSGRLGLFGDRMLKPFASRLIGQFFGNLEQQLIQTNSG